MDPDLGIIIEVANLFNISKSSFYSLCELSDQINHRIIKTKRLNSKNLEVLTGAGLRLQTIAINFILIQHMMGIQ